MKYKKLKQHVAKLEEIAQATIGMPTKAEWKALSTDEKGEAFTYLINQSFHLAAEDVVEAARESLVEESNEQPNETYIGDPDGPGDAPEPVHAIDSILAERGSNYGKFSNHAHLAQTLKSVFDSHVRQYGQPELFTDTMNEAIEMVLHKLSRIGNGTPVYIENWRDVIGYTQLAIDELEKTEGSTDAKVVKMRRQDGEWVDIMGGASSNGK